MHRSPRLQDEGGASDLLQLHSMGPEHQKLDSELLISNTGNMYQTSTMTTQHQNREQLPPLSSLFGNPSSHHNRLSQSPYSDRHSPVYPATSPRDARHPATPVHLDRPYEGSYFQRPPVSRQPSYSSRIEPVERLGFQPPPRSNTAGISPSSPRYEGLSSRLDAPRAQEPHARSGWPTQQHQPRPDYYSRDTSSSFKPHSEQRSLPSNPRINPDGRSGYRDADLPSTPTFPPTPASTVVGDTATTKDGLGPKIWTGTQFLPRFVRQAEVSGEGLCYFYDDGTHCKTVIDGEIVNAHWGVTKAGKPRKRLAIACITCREKKIKCDPDYPRCVQCEKFGRVCKFKNAPRGGQGSPETPPAESDDMLARPGSSQTEADSFKPEKREGSHSVSPHQALRQVTPDTEAHHSKRQRIGYSEFTPVASEASPQPSVLEPVSPATPWTELVANNQIDQTLSREWQLNPFSTNPALVSELVTLLFKHGPNTCRDMFPEGAFKTWFLSANEKSLDDLMLMYSILALSTVFSAKPDHKALGVKYASISRYACHNRHFSIQLVQSRLILAIYYFAVDNSNDSWDFCGSGLRAASGLQLNIELEKSEDASLQSFPYGLSRAGYAECRRRTFWICYLLDKLNNFSSGRLGSLEAEDIFLRYPCDNNSFEAQVDVQNPYFDISSPSIQNPPRTIDLMAHWINITTIWGDVMANIYRSSQRPTPLASNSAFIAFYDRASYRLQQWKDSLPQCYQFSTDNLQREALSGDLSTYMLLHTIYHTTIMKMNRYVQKSTFTTAQLSHHVTVAKQHASETLRMMDILAEYRPVSVNKPASAASRFTSPLIGFAIVSAVDILTSEIEHASVPSRLATFNSSLSILAELATSWQVCKNQQGLVLQRMKDVADLTTTQTTARITASDSIEKTKQVTAGAADYKGVLHMREAIEKTFSRDYDCFYV